jgi:hypothetical protein
MTFKEQVVVPTATVSSASLTFALAPVNTTSVAQTITLSNTGDGPLSLSSIALGGTNAGEFSTTNNCSNSLAPLEVARSVSSSSLLQAVTRPQSCRSRAIQPEIFPSFKFQARPNSRVSRYKFV